MHIKGVLVEGIVYTPRSDLAARRAKTGMYP